MIDRDEIGRRIRAARELRGISQTELDGLLAEDGWGKLDAGRLERGDLRVPFTPGRRDSLVRHLQVPERWFTAENVDDVVGYDPPASILNDLREIREAVEAIRSESRGRYDALDRLLKRGEETERRLRHMSAEEADELLRLLAESRSRLGRDIGKRDLPAGGATDRRAGSGGAGA